jgi:hypothetical protein
MMKRADMNRRDFTKLTAAALGGMLAGASLGRADDKKDDKPKAKDPKKPLLLQEPHVCRGLNTCKGKGKGGKNECAGQGSCYTAAKHTCSGDNACAGLGGCGAKPGENACKGKGECAVPLGNKAWMTARKRFEEEMTKAKKPFGKAPAK